MAPKPVDPLPVDARAVAMLEVAATLATNEKLSAGLEFVRHGMSPLKRKAFDHVTMGIWLVAREDMLASGQRAIEVATSAIEARERADERLAFLEGVLARRQAREDEQVRTIGRLGERVLRLRRLARRLLSRGQRR